jgi:hypothetical protein
MVLFQSTTGLWRDSIAARRCEDANFLAGSHAGAERAAIAYSVCATCALLGVNPVEYLADVLTRLTRGVAEEDVPALMPAAWKAARQAPAPNPA